MDVVNDKLSVLIITFNEERNIERAIDSVQSFADEIIVLDSFSTDKTKEIVQGYPNVTFVERKWAGYSKSKNYLQSLAQYDYVLSLDADEEVDGILATEIRIKKQLGFKGVYELNRLTNYCGQWIKHSGWYPDKKVRIFNKTEAHWDGAVVHESLVYDPDLPYIPMSGHLNHYSYYSFKGHRARADKYSRLTAQKLYGVGQKANFLKPYLSGLFRFISMYFIKGGFRDGFMGFKIAQISAGSNIFKYKELRRLYKESI